MSAGRCRHPAAIVPLGPAALSGRRGELVQPRRRQVGNFAGLKQEFAKEFPRQFHVDGLCRGLEQEFQACDRTDCGAMHEARGKRRVRRGTPDRNTVMTMAINGFLRYVNAQRKAAQGGFAEAARYRCLFRSSARRFQLVVIIGRREIIRRDGLPRPKLGPKENQCGTGDFVVCEFGQCR